MTARHTGQHRLEVENFGPIAKAHIQLRPLTVLVGPSNAGKSYVAKLIYGLHNCFSLPWPFTTKVSRPNIFHERAGEPIDLGEVVGWVTEYLNRDPDSEQSDCPEDVADLAKAAIQRNEMGHLLTRETLRIFGASKLGDLASKSEPHQGKLILSFIPPSSEKIVGSFRYEFGLTPSSKQLSYTLDMPKNAPIRFDRGPSRWRGLSPNFLHTRSKKADDPFPVSLLRLQIVLAHLAQPSTVGAISNPAYYLPASRSGLVEAYGALVGSSLERMTRAGHEPQSGSLSGVLTDFVRETFVNLLPVGSGWKHGSILAERIERTIIDGVVRIDTPENGASAVRYRPVDWEEDLPLACASSMVTDIVPLVLYLRHYATPGSTIIIEEPEAHMHPAMQVRMAAAIAAIVEAGVRVIITTHSEWLLSGLANIVRSAELPMSERKDIGGRGVALPASEVGAWRFLPKADGGTVTQELRLDSEDGMYNAGYPEVGRELYNDWATIVSRLQEE